MGGFRILSAIGLLAASPAWADVTARYAAGESGRSLLTIEVSDRGDSRMFFGNGSPSITRDGVAHLVRTDRRGTYVAREEDWTAIQIEHARDLRSRGLLRFPPSAAAGSSPAAPAYRVARGGSEIVGGRRGTVWLLRGLRGRAGDRTLDFVVSTDGDLAPLGRLLARINAPSNPRSRQWADAGFANDGASHNGIAPIFERGTVIRMGHRMRLKSVDTRPVPASEFVLPSPPLTREQLAARLGGTASP
jgi:hypothetical protein